MGLKTAIDVLLQAGSGFMLFFRNFWDLLPLVIQAMILLTFGLAVLFGLMKMIF